MAVLMLLMALLLTATDMASKTWRSTTEKMRAFENARAGFDLINSTLSQAVLQTYWDYDDPAHPTKYELSSELQFLSLPMNQMLQSGGSLPEANFPTHGLFFQAPTGAVLNQASYGGLPLLLNAYGYYVEYSDDSAEIPNFLKSLPGFKPRYRYRLKQWKVPAESIALYQNTSGVGGKNYVGYPTSLSWIDLANPAATAIAENVVALVIHPINPQSAGGAATELTADFVYNSRNNYTIAPAVYQHNQLPPEVEVIMVAIDEASAVRIFNNSPTSPGLAVGLFTDPTKIDGNNGDLKKLTDDLTQRRLNFIVMRSTVKIRGAGWIQD